MQRIQYILICLILLTFISCESYDQMDGNVASDSVEVCIGAGQGVSTRTSIESDEATVNWTSDDKLAVWAVGNTSGSTVMNGQVFQIKYFSTSISSAVFAANISSMDDTQSYTYRGLYPSSASNDGSTVNYTLPSTQSGEYDASLDYRVALPTVAGALTGASTDDVTLNFEALTHLLKITIPENENLAGVPVKRLYLDFPAAVVGAVSCNFTSSTLTPTLSNGSSSITIELSDDDMIDAGDGRSLWVFINPTSGVSGDLVISAMSANNYLTQDYTITLSNHTFSAGHVTPINTRIEEEYPTTTIQFSIGENYLGEDVEEVTLTAPSGVVFNESGSNVATFAVNSSNLYSASYITEFYDASMRVGDTSVSFESANAIKSGDVISSSNIVANEVNSFSRDVPYLFEEYFSSVSSTGSYDWVEEDSSVADSSIPGLSYWRGSIFYYWSKTSVAVRAYYSWWANNGILILSLDGLTGLKEGKSVSVEIEFYADWKQNKFSTMYLSVYNSADSESIKMSSNSSASYSSITTKRTVVLDGCTSTSELSWETNASSGSGFTYGYDYIYMDNIKISISN